MSSQDIPQIVGAMSNTQSMNAFYNRLTQQFDIAEIYINLPEESNFCVSTDRIYMSGLD